MQNVYYSYLGSVATIVSEYESKGSAFYLKEVCETEMVARAIRALVSK